MKNKQLRTDIISLTESILTDSDLEHLTVKDLRNVLLHAAAASSDQDEENEEHEERLLMKYVI